MKGLWLAGLSAAVLTCAAPAARALSCLAPNPVQQFETAAEAEAGYIVLLGQFDFASDALRNGSADAGPVTARFIGKVLTAEGFTDDYVTAVTLEQTCAGPWCGSFGAFDVLAFVRLDEQGEAVLQIDPCSSRYIAHPSAADIRAVEACMAGSCPGS